MTGLFPPEELDVYALTFERGPEEIRAGLSRLLRLQHLFRTGALAAQAEQNLEQSFNEQVFAQVFGYRSIFADADEPESAGAHSIAHKLYVRLPDKSRAFPDFALGWFRADVSQTVVTAELKGPSANLDAPQGGGYGGKSPVEQALEAACAADATWCLVSNMNECRLYRVPDSQRCERVRLDEITTPHRFRRAYALFSRHSLLGNIPGRPGALAQLHDRLNKGTRMIVPPRTGSARLVQHVRPAPFGREYPFAKLNTFLRESIGKVRQLARTDHSSYTPRFSDETLYVDRPSDSGDHVWQRISVNKAGVLVCSMLEGDGPGPATHIDPLSVARTLADFVALAWEFYRNLNGSKLTFEWTLMDLGPLSCIVDNDDLATAPRGTLLKCADGIASTSYPAWEEWTYQSAPPADRVAKVLAEVVAELLFPFEGVANVDGEFRRFVPQSEKLVKLLQGYQELVRFG